MADRSAHPVEPLAFHPTDTPRGMEFYDLNSLTKVQQHRLNNHKIEVVRENQKYLYKNPEIRGVLQVIMRKILLERPTHDVEQFVGSYFYHHWQSISDEVSKYVAALRGKPSPGVIKAQVREERHVKLDDEIMSDEISSGSVTSSIEDVTVHVVKDILDEILDKVQEQYQQRIKRVQTLDTVEVIEEKHKRASEKSDDEDELIFDLGLDFDLDFSAYHEDDDNNFMQSLSSEALRKSGQF